MRLSGRISPALALASIASKFILLPRTSALIVPRGDLNASLIPTTCASACQPALSVQSNCGSDLKCRCTDANGNSFAECMDCVVGADPTTLAQSAGQGVLSDYAAECAQIGASISSLTLSFATPTASATTMKANAALIHMQHSVALGFSIPRFIFALLIIQALACTL
ncbi:hypothetical protein K438DRAFT_1832684 [Mycena galopus ATCC 62051]|nr:hypothetical protein K438DRAFT_1832684 [Mycena galopus ATCC 62051]